MLRDKFQHKFSTHTMTRLLSDEDKNRFDQQVFCRALADFCFRSQAYVIPSMHTNNYDAILIFSKLAY